MFGNLFILSLLLSFKLALGSENRTVLATHIYDDEELSKIRHQIELLSSRITILDHRLAESLDAVNRRLTETSYQSNRITDILEEVRRKLPAENPTNQIEENLELRLENLNHSLAEGSKDIDSHLPAISNEINKKLPEKNSSNLESAYPTNCLKLAGGEQLTQIDSFSPEPFYVRCDNITHGGGWTVVQRRINGSVDFYRNWSEYKEGFGILSHEFFIGLDKLHALTTTSENELLIVMRDKANEERFATYNKFAIGDETEYYAINVLGEYSGDAGDDLGELLSARFYTYDSDNLIKCARFDTTAWWEPRGHCVCSLNGRHGDDRRRYGINWRSFRGCQYSLPYVEMMIRPRNQ